MVREGGLEPYSLFSQTLQLQGLGSTASHLSAFLSSFSHTISWKWLLQSPKFLRQKGVHIALYWQKICDRGVCLYAQDTDNYTIFAISTLSSDKENNKLCLKRIENYQND